MKNTQPYPGISSHRSAHKVTLPPSPSPWGVGVGGSPPSAPMGIKERERLHPVVSLYPAPGPGPAGGGILREPSPGSAAQK